MLKQNSQSEAGKFLDIQQENYYVPAGIPNRDNKNRGLSRISKVSSVDIVIKRAGLRVLKKQNKVLDESISRFVIYSIHFYKRFSEKKIRQNLKHTEKKEFKISKV